MKTFLKLKVEASGWPCEGEKERAEFIQKYRDFENVFIEAAHVEKNPVKRAVAKLMLNSLWVHFFFFLYKNNSISCFLGETCAKNETFRGI